MKKRIIKKYAHELLRKMQWVTDFEDMGYTHKKFSECTILKGNRARLLTSDAVINYINDNIRPIKSFWGDKPRFNNHRRYLISYYAGGVMQHLHCNDYEVHRVYDFELSYSNPERPMETWFDEQKCQWVYKRPTMPKEAVK